MRVFPDLRCNSAVIVDDVGLDCVLVSQSEFGVCVSVSGDFGHVFLVSMYCKFSEALEPYLRYMDEVLLLVSSHPVILGLDANASSPMWFSKMSRHSSGYQNYTRGEMLSEWFLSRSIDAALRQFRFAWSVSDELGISDHNLIEVVITPAQVDDESSPDVSRWPTRGIDWTFYGQCVKEAFLSTPLDVFSH